MQVTSVKARATARQQIMAYQPTFYNAPTVVQPFVAPTATVAPTAAAYPVFNLGTFTQGRYLQDPPQQPVYVPPPQPVIQVPGPAQVVNVDYNLPGSFRSAELPTGLRKDLLDYMYRSVTPGTRGTVSVGARGESITFHRL